MRVLTCHIVDANGAQDGWLFRAMERAERMLAAYVRAERSALAWWCGAEALEELKLLATRLHADSGLSTTLSEAFAPLGYRIKEMPGLGREIVLTTRENWLLLSPGLFKEPEAAVLIYNIGKGPGER